MITAIEFALLLGGADGEQQAEAIASLFDRGLIAAVVHRDMIVGIQGTKSGDCA
jgi:hypothetical protein